jgi:Lrp/AsnC family leucine-responsive transcriptional regulator
MTVVVLDDKIYPVVDRNNFDLLVRHHVKLTHDLFPFMLPIWGDLPNGIVKEERSNFLNSKGSGIERPMNSKGLLTDDINLTLLHLLEKNPRAPISQLARRVGMSNPAVKERILRMEESGVLTGYRLELNPKELGYHVIAFVRVRPIPGHLNKIAELAQTIPEITECHRVTGEDCFILKIFLKEISNLDRVLDKFLAHGQTTTSIVQSSPVPPRTLPLPRG